MFNQSKTFMMKILAIIVIIVLSACTPNEKPEQETNHLDTVENKPKEQVAAPETFNNERFRDIRIEKAGENKYRVSGKGQIFEANFSYVVEDGLNELVTGNVMTDAGAPEWGNFEFIIELDNDEPSHKTLILFESSPEDGSRQHELIIPLD